MTLRGLTMDQLDGRRNTYEAIKRCLDLSLSLVGLCLLAPLMALIAVAVRLDSPGPVLFRQTRVGRDGCLFTMYKFRSMWVDAPSTQHEAHMRRLMRGEASGKLQGDPRITRFGRILRQTSLDELPQLFNVVRGEMSLVGPRPPIPYEVEWYDARQRGRLTVTPGLTGLWQVGGRASRTFAEQVQLDLDYIARRSLRLDLEILLKTPLAVLTGKGSG